MRAVEKLVANVVQQTESEIDAGQYQQKTRELLWRLDRRIPALIDETEAEAAALRLQRETETEKLPNLEARIEDLEEVLDEAFRFYRSHIGHLDTMGLGSVKGRGQAAERLTVRASNLVGRLEHRRKQLDAAGATSAAAPGDVSLEADVVAAQARLDRVATSLWTTCDIMDDLDIETAEYRKTLITATGELTTDVLDLEVLEGLFEDLSDWAQRWLVQRAPKIFGRVGLFLGILALFSVLGVIARKVVERVIGESRENLSELARRMIVSFASRIVVMIGFFVALSQVGVNVTALLTGLGIAGFIVGFALQDTLGNFASGAMILAYRPFDVGDTIEAGGISGKVHNMNLVSTTILTFDNQTLVVPNSKIWGDVIRNVTAQQIRRVDLEFHLAHDVDVVQAESLFGEICSGHPEILDDPAPAIHIHKVTPAAVVFIVRPWVKTQDYWPTYWGLTREAKLRLAAEGIAMGAEPHTVRLESDAASPVE
ncbi:MAG: mechanosensitive ion channel [Deltaproteobacteria bacterium]|nr:mechanosensitive ion channel [Deltaproteobacteria bacterium]